MRTLPILRAMGYPLVFDATHSVQEPGGQGATTGGRREFAPLLARAATAAGVDALFLEVHNRPEEALSDGANMITPAMLDMLLGQVKDIDAIVKASS